MIYTSCLTNCRVTYDLGNWERQGNSQNFIEFNLVLIPLSQNKTFVDTSKKTAEK